jgi:7,8-dihydroneopterin aldolase/epimerase/oxygenase
MGIVSVNKLRVYGYHGCLPEEAEIGTWFLIDIDVHYDFTSAALTDDLTRTVDYVELCNIAKEEMAIRANLIETVAHRIVKKINKKYPEASKVNLRLYKLNPPANAQLDSVSVTIDY